MTWQLVTVAPQKERSVATTLKTRFGVKTSVPSTQTLRKARGKGGKPILIPVLRPLIPGYVFAQISADIWANLVGLAQGRVEIITGFVNGELVSTQSHAPAERFSDITGRVMFNGRIAQISDIELDHLKRIAKEADRPAASRAGYAEGDLIRITEGPFRNFEALISEVKGSAVTVTVALFGRENDVKLRPDQIEKAA